MWEQTLNRLADAGCRFGQLSPWYDVDDVAANQMARDVVKKIEETLSYPGQIKVTVIRESRSVEYAR